MRANQNGALLSAACRALCCYVVVLLCKPNSAVAHGPRTAWRSWIESGAAAQKPPANESTSEIPKCYANRIAAGCGGRKSTSARATERPPTGTRRASVRMTGNTGDFAQRRSSNYALNYKSTGSDGADICRLYILTCGNLAIRCGATAGGSTGTSGTSGTAGATTLESGALRKNTCASLDRFSAIPGLTCGPKWEQRAEVRWVRVRAALAYLRVALLPGLSNRLPFA